MTVVPVYLKPIRKRIAYLEFPEKTFARQTPLGNRHTRLIPINGISVTLARCYVMPRKYPKIDPQSGVTPFLVLI
jgi:hypothetical protein